MINFSNVIRFLLFDRDAIKTIADSRTATWLGLTFVISAGFAREYDGEYLLAEPWHLLIPVAASLIGCFLMVIFIFGLAFRGVKISFWQTLRSFINVYWMTAPMAWLYAIPFEQFLRPVDATSANLWMLGFVATWRVALMVRCMIVIYDTNWFTALVPVILFSDILAILALEFAPGPIFMLMGGVRQTESEQLIASFRLLLNLLCYLTMPIWIISYLLLIWKNPPWQWTPNNNPERNLRVSRSCWAVAIVSLLVWIPILPLTQPQQHLRWKGEKLLSSRQFDAFAKLMTEHDETEFPAHWDPPPRVGYGERAPSPAEVMVSLQKHNASQWIIDRYIDKMSRRQPDGIGKVDDLKHFVEAIESMPADQQQQMADSIEHVVEKSSSKGNQKLFDRVVALMSPAVRERVLERLSTNGEMSEAPQVHRTSKQHSAQSTFDPTD